MTTTNKDTLIAELIKMAQDIKALNILDVTAEDISTYDDVTDYQSSIDDLHNTTTIISRRLDELKHLCFEAELVMGSDNP